MVPDRPIVTADVRKFLDLVQMRNRVTSHGPPIVAVRRGPAKPSRRQASARSDVQSGRQARDESLGSLVFAMDDLTEMLKGTLEGCVLGPSGMGPPRKCYALNDAGRKNSRRSGRNGNA
jgi:hypothetical protein